MCLVQQCNEADPGGLFTSRAARLPDTTVSQYTTAAHPPVLRLMYKIVTLPPALSEIQLLSRTDKKCRLPQTSTGTRCAYNYGKED
ncbi:hypothetical protein J6590_057955 [Homalodisca vitripennis]|nr:hypothetical protein J6590_057955 [Homalodisca vitripennis]